MRTSICAFLMSTMPAALFAQEAAHVEATAKIVAVTLFAQGAQVTRTVNVPEGPGIRQFLIPGLPDGTDLGSLRVLGDGIDVGAVTLIDARPPVAEGEVSVDVLAARAEVARVEAVLASKKDEVAAIRAGATAARAQVDFLRNMSNANTPLADLPKLAEVVGDGVLRAEQAAISAEAQARRADIVLKPDEEAVETARRALAALEHPAKAHDTLRVDVSGGGELTITTFVQDAGWLPTYDLRLDEKAHALALERFVSVRQATGEDWSGVDLRLSTARPSERAEPSQVWPALVQSGPEEAPVMEMADPRTARKMDMVAMAAPAAGAAVPEMQGATLTYRYPGLVDVRDGVDGLRLKLGAVQVPVKVLAEAVPMFDDVAYRVVEGKVGGEPLLSGPAALFVDGAMVGVTHLPFLAAGDDLRMGFGAIDGLRLKRVMPEASEGGRGVISRSNERQEVVVSSVQNLTGRDWPVRLIDRVPYSEQDNLKITWKASVAPEFVDWDDKRGVLAWEFDLPADNVQDVRLETTLSWPAGQVLR